MTQAMTETDRNLPEGVQRVAAVLQDAGHPHVPIMLADACHTAQQAADALGVQLGQIAKSIVFRRKSDDAAVLVIASGDRRVNERRVAALVGAIGRADARFVKAQTGFSIGGVSPVGHTQPPVTLIDRDLHRFDEIWAAAGHPNSIFRLTPADLQRLTGALVAHICMSQRTSPDKECTMKQITFHLDFLSPFSYLAFEHLPRALQGLDCRVQYRPFLLGAVLKHFGTRGPAVIPHKGEWTFRHVMWLGHTHGIPLDMPAMFPYNPLPHLRLALATSHDGDISHTMAETIFHEVWRGGHDAVDPQRLAALGERLPRVREPDSDEVKAQLKANTDAAIAAGVFGAPAFEVDGRLFWGFDSLPMLRAFLEGDPWFSGPTWAAAAQWPSALRG